MFPVMVGTQSLSLINAVVYCSASTRDDGLFERAMTFFIRCSTS